MAVFAKQRLQNRDPAYYKHRTARSVTVGKSAEKVKGREWSGRTARIGRIRVPPPHPQPCPLLPPFESPATSFPSSIRSSPAGVPVVRHRRAWGGRSFRAPAYRRERPDGFVLFLQGVVHRAVQRKHLYGRFAANYRRTIGGRVEQRHQRRKQHEYRARPEAVGPEITPVAPT